MLYSAPFFVEIVPVIMKAALPIAPL